MPTPQSHSKVYAPSKSSTWLKCPLSIIYNDGASDEPNDQALYGTDTHELASHLLTKALDIKMYDEEQLSTEELIKNLKMYDECMLSLAKGYVKYVLDNYEYEYKRTGIKPLIVIEQHVDFGFDDDAGGTLDCGIISSDGVLSIIDLKTGRIKVQTYNEETKEFNSQLGLYAYGMYETFNDLYNIKKVRLAIYQPLVKNTNDYEMDIDDLLKWVKETVLPSVAKTKAPNLVACPGPIQCKYCPGNKGKCVSRIKNAMSDAKEVMNRSFLTTEDYEEILPKLDEIISVCESIKEEALRKAQNGVRFKNYKLVRSSVKRKISNENEVIKICKNENVDPFAPQKIVGITELQKRMGKERFTKLITPYLVVQESGYALVNLSDERDEVIIEKRKENK